MDENVPLAPLTTIGVGGSARYLTRVRTRAGVQAAVAWAADAGVPLMALGRGSNMLIGDDGFPGLVLRVGIPGAEVVETNGAVEVTVGAGVSWAALVRYAVARNWAGIECMAGIPGLVGASPVQNIGAYGQEVRETIVRVEALDLRTRHVVSFDNAGCCFGYRTSRFRGDEAGCYLILSVTYRFTPGGAPYINYVELDRKLAAWAITAPTIQDVYRAVWEIRRSKSMVLREGDPNARSAGSFFTNAQLTEAQMQALDEAIARELPGARIPRFLQPEGNYKAPAAWLIERAGFERGHCAGPVGLSTNHALAIINRGGATARDVLALARAIRDAVHARFGVHLAPEPVLIGCAWE
ncbi:MAG: UDP-N-acetylenolpyruvoylglucosamine reductase [bacterium ADurb.Bin429]|nr:MAG: UDP-N-acetylenolpyruvoylglucosamine reductase [bacterium ADurb.Bin429]